MFSIPFNKAIGNERERRKNRESEGMGGDGEELGGEGEGMG